MVSCEKAVCLDRQGGCLCSSGNTVPTSPALPGHCPDLCCHATPALCRDLPSSACPGNWIRPSGSSQTCWTCWTPSEPGSRCLRSPQTGSRTRWHRCLLLEGESKANCHELACHTGLTASPQLHGDGGSKGRMEEAAVIIRFLGAQPKNFSEFVQDPAERTPHGSKQANPSSPPSRFSWNALPLHARWWQWHQ